MNTAEIVNQLENLKEEIDKAKEDLAQDKGKLSVLMEKLLNDFNISTVEEATQWIKKESIKIEKEEAQLESDFNKLQANYEW